MQSMVLWYRVPLGNQTQLGLRPIHIKLEATENMLTSKNAADGVTCISTALPFVFESSSGNGHKGELYPAPAAQEENRQ